MDINRGNLDALFTGFKTALQKGLDMATKPIEQLATVVPSSTAIEKYPLLFLLSTIREWVGPRVIADIQGEVLQVTNDDYEHTIGVNRNDIDDDQLGLYTPLFQKMGQDAANLWGKLVIDAMCANGDWLDDNAFFYASRTFGSNTINNTTTSALSESTFNTAYNAMMAYKAHNNQPLGVVPDLLVVGPKLRATGFEILKASKHVKASGTVGVAAVENPNYNVCDLMIHPDLVGTYDDYWFLLQTKGVVKPVLLQKRKTGTLQRWDKDSDECVKTHNRNDYGLHFRGAAALSLPPLAYAGIVS